MSSALSNSAKSSLKGTLIEPSSLQKFAAVHSSVQNHFNQERGLYSRDNFKLNRAAALADWRQLAAA